MNILEKAIYPQVGKNPYYPALGLGEAGEVQNVIKKVMRDNNGVLTEEAIGKVKKELGDLLWYVAILAHECGLELDDIMQANIDKLNSRKERGVLNGSGDDR